MQPVHSSLLEQDLLDTPSTTAAHYIWFKDDQGMKCRKEGNFFFVSQIERTFYPATSLLCYKMKPIYHNNRDICRLQIENDAMNSVAAFRETIPICNPGTTNFQPTSSNQEYRVKVYHATISFFRDELVIGY